jgi:hypothetical protein
MPAEQYPDSIYRCNNNKHQGPFRGLFLCNKKENEKEE